MSPTQNRGVCRSSLPGATDNAEYFTLHDRHPLIPDGALWNNLRHRWNSSATVTIGEMSETENEDHGADHDAIRAAFLEWQFDAETRDDILRDALILHLGAFHGWTVVGRGVALGLAPMLARHDRDHQATDVFGVESDLDPQIVEAIQAEP